MKDNRFVLFFHPFRIALLVVVLALPKMAQGHPHEWIDLRVSFEFDDEKRLIALEQSWLFDPYFSAYVIEELATGRPRRKRALDQAMTLGPEMVSNLSAHSYLNEWSFAGQPVEGLTGTFVSARIKGKQMELVMRLEAPEPLDLSDGEFEYAVFDPLYYIEILHAPRYRPRLKGAPKGCRAKVVIPEPPEDLVIYASELDRNDDSEDGLGQHFAERLIISCPAP